ncbi:MAG: 4Fe-4S binding protein [Candidatus Diapherotrites archaeon]
MKREIVEIDEEKCNGCGLCIPNCYEGALQVIDGKARLISDLFCDGLGNCLGHCPEGAITIVEREAEAYDERKVMEKISKQGRNVVKAHLQHLKDHKQEDLFWEAVNYLEEMGEKNPLEVEGEYSKTAHSNDSHNSHEGCSCPGAAMMDLRKETRSSSGAEHSKQESELQQWPVQLNLLPPNAPYFQNSDLLIAADCTAYANANFHSQLLKGKSVAIGCPKLDDIGTYKEKIKSIIEMNDLNTITVAIMEVPCCGGLYSAVEEALDESGKRITLKKVVIGIDGLIRE